MFLPAYHMGRQWQVQAGEKGNDLDRFAKTHLITQNATHVLNVELPKPFEACLLIVEKSVPDETGHRK